MKNSFIRSNPAILMGKPVVAGTRITVKLILENSPLARQPRKYSQHIPV